MQSPDYAETMPEKRGVKERLRRKDEFAVVQRTQLILAAVLLVVFFVLRLFFPGLLAEIATGYDAFVILSKGVPERAAECLSLLFFE